MSAPLARFITLEELTLRRDEWRALSENAIETNPFYGPDLLIAALQSGASRSETRVLIVERNDRLTGLFPLQRPFLRDGAMGLGWMLYRDPLTCLTVPLIAPAGAKETLATALAFLSEANGPAALVLPLLTENQPFATLLKRVVEKQMRFAVPMQSWERPAIARGSVLLPKAARAIEKKRRRLEKLGPISVRRMMSGNPDVSRLLDDFLTMEALSWKGEQGTALRSMPALEQVVRALAVGYTTSPAFLIEALMVGEQPIAMNLNLAAAGTVYTIKSTYHPEFASYSPGRLLDAMVVSLVEAPDGAFLSVDSCASPGHPLEDLWPDRLDLVCLGIALRPSGRLHLGAMMLGKSLSDQVRRWRYRESYTTRKTNRAA
ncbi:MAG: GNAT family N-acetyltransferase [Beijerinckiaceae bacterium]|jgi:CelD/BcsL family acetyltransferase involved in cellulose biosynthesis|nr:GNAT family N-acetyltransferase [Beijerinckiaceae bacterium]